MSYTKVAKAKISAKQGRSGRQIDEFGSYSGSAGSMIGEDSFLERVTAAAKDATQLSHNSLIAYRRTWLESLRGRRPKVSSPKPCPRKG